jgi:hypothetical protein
MMFHFIKRNGDLQTSITGLPCCLEFAEHCFLFSFLLLFSYVFLRFCIVSFLPLFLSPLALPRGLMMNESMPYTHTKRRMGCIW